MKIIDRLGEYLYNRKISKVQPYQEEYVLNMLADATKDRETVSLYELRMRCGMELDEILYIIAKLVDDGKITQTEGGYKL